MMKRTFLIGACLLALAVGVVACGNSDSDTTDSTGGAATTNEQDGAAATAEGNIVAVAQKTPELTTLVEAVGAAGLVETLEEPGPYTVFAPTNAAFDALGNTLDRLLEPANKAELSGILTYHVVPGELSSTELSDGQKLKTVQGGTLQVKIANGEVTVNGAKVATADVEASNGIVHVIDEVLIPPQG